MSTALERFMAKVAPQAGGCWLWKGSTKPGGYGSWGAHGKTYQAHRFAYEALVGPIPAGLVIDHLCRVRNCVNPAHLEPVTTKENVRRSLAGPHGVSETHCRHGHERTPENTYRRLNGCLDCRSCAQASRQKHVAAKPTYGLEQAMRGRRHDLRKRLRTSLTPHEDLGL